MAHAVLREELHGVIAEAGVERIELAGHGGVGAHFKDARLAAFFDLQGRGEGRGRHEDALRCLGEDFAAFFAGFARSLPFGIGTEGFEARFGGVFAGVLEHVDERGLGTVFFIDGHPVADVFHAMLFEELAGMIAEAGEERVELAFVAGVDAEFVNRICDRGGEGGEKERGGGEEGAKGHARMLKLRRRVVSCRADAF